MFLLKKIIASLVLPPTSLILLAVAGLMLASRRPRLGRWLMAVALAGLVLLSLPRVAHELQRSLEEAPPISASALAEAQAIVVLGGGSYRGAPEYGGDTVNRHSLERLRYGARLARRTGLPLLVTGGAPFGGRPEAEAMQEALQVDFGLSARWVEPASRDTAENAAFSAPLLKAAGIARIALVTHAWHMPRARLLFEREGLTVLPAPTGFTIATGGIGEWLPSAAALEKNRLALHELLGQLASQRRGGNQ